MAGGKPKYQWYGRW